VGRLAKWLTVLVAFIVAVIIVDVGVLWVLTKTDWGHERVRNVAVGGLEKIVHGRASIAKVSGGVLSNITLQHVVITDSAGAPFVSVDSITTSYSISDLFRRRILLDHAVFVRPYVVLDQGANGVWNWQRVLPWLHDTSKVKEPPSKEAQWGDWIRMTDGQIVNGRLVMHSPWAPAPNLSRAAADSATRDAVSGNARVFVERGPGGLRRRIEIDSITAKVPLLRLSQPGQPSSVVELAPLAMNAYFLRPPAGQFRDLRGAFAFSGDSIWWASATTSFPRGTRASGSGSFVFGTGNMTLTLHGDPVVFDDVRWAYMPLPPEARGKFDFALRWRGLTQDYAVSRADVTLRQARALGSFGITLDDSVTIHDTDLRFSGIDTHLLSDIIPGLKLPRTGVFAGRATVRGGRRSMNVKGDITFNDRSAGVSRFVAEGQIGILDRNVVRARGLRVQMLPLQVAMLRTWRPELPIGGTVTGTTTVNGTTATQLSLSMDITHHDSAETSAIAGSATLHTTGPTQVDADVVAFPLSLVEVGRFFPSAGLRGTATGPIHAHGFLNSLKIDTDLHLPDSGRVVAKGTFDVADTAKGYDLTAAFATLNLHAVVAKAPVTSLTAKLSAAGRGTDPATLSSKVVADFSTSHVVKGADSIALDTLSIRATAANGEAHIEKLFAGGAQTRATVIGSFGLDTKHVDSLTYAIVVDSLGALNRWLPKSTDSTAVKARPAVVRRIMANARADSARTAKRTEMERMVHRQPGPKLVVIKPQPVPRDTISGRLFLVGTLSGNLDKFDLRGRAEGDSIVARGNTVQRVVSTYAWRGGRATPSAVAIAADADRVGALGFGFDTAMARFTYAAPGPEDDGGRGHIELSVIQRDTADRRVYEARGDYSLHPDRRVLRLAKLTLQFDSALWAMPHADTVTWGKAGVQFANFELRNRSGGTGGGAGGGRIRLRGEVTTGKSDSELAIDVDSLPVTDVVKLLQSDVVAAGDFSLHGTVRGTASNPTFSSRFELTGAEYNETPFPDLRGRATYADERLVAHADAFHGTGEPLVTLDARLPLNLAFADVKGDRVLNEPMSIDVVGDSLPIDLIPDVTDLVSDVHGRAAGKLAIRGTFAHPTLAGLATLDHATTTIVYTGATIENITGTIHMAGDSVYIDSLVGNARGPVRLSGSLGFANWSEPSFNLELKSDAARLVNNDVGDLRLDTDLTLKGPFKKAAVGGDITIARGVVHAPEGSQQTLVGPGDPGLFNVIDTTSELARRLFPPQSPLLENLSVNVAVRVNPNTWVRNRQANIEIYSSEPLYIRDSSQTLTVRGVIYTDRGDYTLLTKRFQIRRGSATFVDGPDLNPTLQITGEYQVNVATRGTINIQVLVGGTLKNPNVSLESDAQPPRSQSDLLTLIAFGQSTSSLIATSGSSVVATGAADVVGSGTQFVTWRLATIATGVLAEQAEFQAGRSLNADVFRITPADTPIEAGSGGIGGFFTRTKIEAGKYITPRTFVALQQQAANIGASIERRTLDGWRITATFEPQVVLLEPTLNSQPTRAIRSVGGFVIRDWRF
jgi:translocation and assembly module TamB